MKTRCGPGGVGAGRAPAFDEAMERQAVERPLVGASMDCDLGFGGAVGSTGGVGRPLALPRPVPFSLIGVSLRGGTTIVLEELDWAGMSTS